MNLDGNTPDVSWRFGVSFEVIITLVGSCPIHFDLYFCPTLIVS